MVTSQLTIHDSVNISFTGTMQISAFNSTWFPSAFQVVWRFAELVVKKRNETTLKRIH
jgi:hypothetical protein